MKKLLTLAFVLVLIFTSCEKVSIEDYPSAIVGWWELVNSNPTDPDLSEGYRWVMEFKDNYLPSDMEKAIEKGEIEYALVLDLKENKDYDVAYMIKKDPNSVKLTVSLKS